MSVSSKYWFTPPLSIFPNNWNQSRSFWKSLAARRKIKQDEQSWGNNIYQAPALQRKQFNLLENEDEILSSVYGSICMGHCWTRILISSWYTNRSNWKEELWIKRKRGQCYNRKSNWIRICQSHAAEYSKGNMGQNHSKLWRWCKGKKWNSKLSELNMKI